MKSLRRHIAHQQLAGNGAKRPTETSVRLERTCSCTLLKRIRGKPCGKEAVWDMRCEECV